MLDGETDEALMERVAMSDQRALGMLMERHMARTIALAERIVGRNSDADDIAQEAFVRVWKHASTFEPARARFSTWLYRIAVNLSLDQKRRPVHEDLDKAPESASDDPQALEALLAREEETQVAMAMAALSERQRAAVALFHLEGLSGREAAEAMNLSEKAFESLLSRARASLRQAVNERGPERRRQA